MTGEARAPDGAVPRSDAPAARSARPVRVGLGVLGVALLVLVAFVAWGESQGWPFLADPLQRRLSAAMHRDVSLAPQDGGPAQARIHLLGGLRVDAPRIRISAPQWSREPHLLLATEASFRFGYGDVLRAWRGGPLHIRSIRAEQLDLAVERLADGRASWQFQSDPDQPARPAPTIGQLEVPDGAVRYRDAILDAAVDSHFTLIDGSGRPASTAISASAAASEASPGAGAPAAAGSARGLRVVANGKYRGFPVKGRLETYGILPLAGDEAASIAMPVELDATVGRARLQFRGTATDAVHLGAMTGVFTLAGPSLAAVGDPLGVTLPTTPAFRTEGRIAQRGDVWNAVFDSARIGSSRLAGAFTYDVGRPRPLLSGRLSGSRLLLADLGPAIGTAAPASAASGPETKARAVKTSGRVLPEREFDLPALRAMDANVAIDLAEVDLGTRYLEPLRPMRAHLQLNDGVLRLTDIDARTGQGRLAGTVQLDGREKKRAVWTTALRVADVRLERWVRQTRSDGAPPYVSGRLRGIANLRGEGRSTAQILATLKGQVGFQLQDGKISHLAVEAAGIDIAQGLGLLIAGDKALDVQCGVADLQAQAGILRPRAFVLDTTDSTLAIDGSVSMVDETLDLRAIVSPKDFSPLALRTPLHVRGPFDAPKVSLEKGPLARRLGAAALMALVTPIAALLPLVDTGDPDGAAQALAEGCRSLVKRSGATAAKAAPPAASSPARSGARRS